jgi:hypothetical protein
MVGKTKKEVYAEWGPADQSDTDGGDGEILTYKKKGYLPGTGSFWMCRLLYLNKDGVVVHWKTYNEQIPPDRVEVKHLN